MVTNVEAIAGAQVRTRPAVQAARLRALQPGAIMVAPGADLPEPLRPYLRPFGTWHVVEPGLAREFHKAVAAAGLRYSFIAEPIAAAAIAFDSDRAVAAAIDKLFRTSAARFSVAEIAGVSLRRFAGLVQAEVTAYPRQVGTLPELWFDERRIAAMWKRIEQTARRFRYAHGSDATLARLAGAPISGI